MLKNRRLTVNEWLKRLVKEVDDVNVSRADAEGRI